MACQRIKLKKDFDGHKAGSVLTATAEAIRSRALVAGEDYEALGTLPQPAPCELSAEPATGVEETGKEESGTPAKIGAASKGKKPTKK